MTHDKIKEQAVERIWLFPGEHDGEITLLWGDDPAPGEGMDASEAVEYVRKDVHDAAIADLEAHIERLDNELQEKALTNDGVLADAYWNCADMITPWLGEKAGPDTLINSVAQSLEFLIEQWREKKIVEKERDQHRTAEEAQIALRQKMEQERDRQAAYLDRLSRAIGACMSNDERKFVFSPDDYLELEHALDATFSESLARRDALNKAGAMDWVLAQSCNEENEGVMWRTKIVEPEIQRLRQQAERC